MLFLGQIVEVSPMIFVTLQFALCVVCFSPAPSVLLVSMEGVAACLDPSLLQWFAYLPRTRLPASDTSSVAVDVPLAEATSPLQVSGSRSKECHFLRLCHFRMLLDVKVVTTGVPFRGFHF